MIPDSLGSLDDIRWTPVDILSDILVELVLQSLENETALTEYYHLDNPESCQWSSLVPVIQQYFSRLSSPDGGVTEGKLKVVSFKDWVNALEESGRQKEVDVTKNPALKLLPFYAELSGGSGYAARLDTTETRSRSETMRSLKAVNEEWMRLWLEQWKF